MAETVCTRRRYYDFGQLLLLFWYEPSKTSIVRFHVELVPLNDHFNVIKIPTKFIDKPTRYYNSDLILYNKPHAVRFTTIKSTVQKDNSSLQHNYVQFQVSSFIDNLLIF